MNKLRSSALAGVVLIVMGLWTLKDRAVNLLDTCADQVDVQTALVCICTASCPNSAIYEDKPYPPGASAPGFIPFRSYPLKPSR